jgi:hypothetical protein
LESIPGLHKRLKIQARILSLLVLGGSEQVLVSFPQQSHFLSFIWLDRVDQGLINYIETKETLRHTANEGPERIQYKYLVPIYVFPEMKLCSLVISKTVLLCSVFQFLHSYICEKFIYFQDQLVYFSAAKYVDRSWEYINRS